MAADPAVGIRKWLIENYGLDGDRLQFSTPLFTSGWLDSFNFVEVVTEFERSSGLRVNPLDWNFENFDTLDKMAAYAAREASANS